MTQAVVQVRNIVARSGFANPLTLEVLVADEDYLKVYADTTLLDNGTDYEITGIGDPNGISIEIIGAEDPDNYVGVETFTALYDPPYDQQSDLSAGGVLGRGFETGLDQQNRRLQALGDRVDRSLKVNVNIDGDIVLDPVDGQVPVWNEDTQQFDWTESPASSAASAAAAAASAATAAAEAAAAAAEAAAAAAAAGDAEAAEAAAVVAQQAAEAAQAAAEAAAAAAADKLPLAGGTMTAPIGFTHQASPADPAAGVLVLFAKSDDKFYSRSSAGVETEIGAAAGIPSVTDYGAVGDNVTDDSAAFAAAFAAESRLYVPPGTYYLANVSLAVTNKAFTLEGAGIGVSVLRWNGSAGGIAVEQDADSYHLLVKNMSLLQSGVGVGTALAVDGSGQISGGVIQDRTAPRVKIENVYIAGATSPDVDGWSKHVVGVSPIHWTVDGVHVVGNYDTTMDNITSVSAIEFTGSGSPVELLVTNTWGFHVQSGVVAADTEGVFVSKCHFVKVNWGLTYSATVGESQVTFIQNHVNGYVGGVQIDNCSHNDISHNLFFKTASGTFTCIEFVSGVTRSTVIGNVLAGGTGTDTGIDIGPSGGTGCANIIISSNLFSNLDTGILLGTAVQAVRITANKYDTVTTAVTDSGSNNEHIFDGNKGTAAKPSISFWEDLNTGFYWGGADQIGVSVAGAFHSMFHGSGLGVGVTPPLSRLHAAEADAVTNAVTQVARLRHTTSGAPANGIGTGLAFETETSDGNLETGMTLEAVVTDVTATSEDFDFVVKLMKAGAAVAEAFRVRSTGALVTLGQIEFPATANPSSNANTLDEYEEGTFTPVLQGTSTAGTGTYSAQIGSYVKIGKSVTFLLEVVWTAHDGTGNMQFAGLPFTNGGAQSVCGIEVSNLTYAAQLFALISASNTIVVPYTAATGGANTAVPMDTAATFRATGVYIAAT